MHPANKKKITTSSRTFLLSPERLMFLIDGVFAITLTLLVLDLRLPEALEGGLAAGLKAMLPRLGIYLIAFYTIANHWVLQYVTFRHVRKVNNTLVWLALLLLLFITLLPASTAIVGASPFAPLALLCFSVNSFFLSLAAGLFWSYVYRQHDSLADDDDPRRLSILAAAWFIISAGFLAAIPIAYLNVYPTYLIWIFWPYLVSTWAGRYRKRLDAAVRR